MNSQMQRKHGFFNNISGSFCGCWLQTMNSQTIFKCCILNNVGESLCWMSTMTSKTTCKYGIINNVGKSLCWMSTMNSRTTLKCGIVNNVLLIVNDEFLDETQTRFLQYDGESLWWLWVMCYRIKLKHGLYSESVRRPWAINGQTYIANTAFLLGCF